MTSPRTEEEGVGGTMEEDSSMVPATHPHTSAISPRFGSRSPSFRSVPDSAVSDGEKAVKLAAGAGLDLDPWQADFLVDALGRTSDGGWSATEVGLIVPRQNGKGAILEARMLAGLFLFGEQLGVYTSHEVKSSQEIFRRLVGLIESTPELSDQVDAVRWANGQEAIELKSGARVRFIARSRKSGRGFSADAVYFDEAFELSSDIVAAAVPTLSAVDRPQIWYVSSAPHAHSEVLRQVQTRGREGSDPSLAYTEWCASDSVESDDPDAVATANPALGIRLTLDFTAKERGVLDDESFRRERLGISVDYAAASSVIDLVTWQELADPTSQPVGQIFLAIDVSPDRGDAAVAVAGKRRDDFFHVELVEARKGVGWVAGRVADLLAAHDDLAEVVVDGRGPGAALIPDLFAAGVSEELLTIVGPGDMANACGIFFDHVAESRLRYLANPDLDEALRAASQRPLGDAWAWSRRRGGPGRPSPLLSVSLSPSGLRWWPATPILPRRSGSHEIRLHPPANPKGAATPRLRAALPLLRRSDGPRATSRP